MYYTLDGTEPSNMNGTLYSSAIHVDANDGESKTVKIVSYKGSQKGQVVSNVYLFDKVAPTAVITSNKEVAKIGDVVIFTAVFNEALVGIPVFNLTDGIASSASNPSGDKKTWVFQTNTIAWNGLVKATLASATDAAGNVISTSGISTGVFGDNIAPLVTGVLNGMTYHSVVQPVFEANALATLRKSNGVATPFMSGTNITTDGTYQLVVTDAVGNTTSVQFTIDTVVPTVVSSTIQSNQKNPQLAKAGDTVKLQVKASENVVISNVQAKIGAIAVGNITINDAGDFDATTWEIALVVGSEMIDEGELELAFKMTDAAGNMQNVDFGMVTDGSKVMVDSKPATIMSGTLESTNKYVDIMFSEPVYGGSAEMLSALAATDFTAVSNNVGGNINPVAITIDRVTKLDDTPVVGGESAIRLHLTFAGTLVQGDKVEIKAAHHAIFDRAGNITAATATSGELNVKPLVTYQWNEANDTITFTSGLTVSAYANNKVQLMGNKYNPNVFLTSPTDIGGDTKLKISVTAGWDGEAVFGATANGVYAQATALNTIQFSANTQCSAGDSGCFITTNYRRNQLFVIIQDRTNPAVKTILELNIDSSRKGDVIIKN